MSDKQEGGNTRELEWWVRKTLVGSDDPPDWIQEIEDGRDGSADSARDNESESWLDEIGYQNTGKENATSDSTSVTDTSGSAPTITVLHSQCDDCDHSSSNAYHGGCRAPIVHLDGEWRCGRCGSSITPRDDCPSCGTTVTIDRRDVPLDMRPDVDVAEVEWLVHKETNRRRQNHGLTPLDYDDHLSAIAFQHSRDMAQRGFFDHQSPDGSGPSDRYRRFGHDTRSSGENIALTHPGLDTSAREAARSVVDEWMNSPDHRENILRGRFDDEGIGIHFTATGAMYSTQNFF